MTSSEEKKCAREFCSFSAPLKDWKIKRNGVSGKWCEHCCELAAAKSERVKARKQEASGVPFKTKTYTVEEKARREEKQRVETLSLVRCDECGQEMLPSNMKRHRMYNCKGGESE